MKRIFFSLLLICIWSITNATSQFVTFKGGDMPIVQDGSPVDILVDDNDFDGVRMAAESLQDDILAVCGTKPNLLTNADAPCIIIGSMQSGIIQQMVQMGKIKKSHLVGKTEKYLLQIVRNPIPGIRKALVIAGSDKRGTIYGIYELSRQMGVSPWYWWMDVPVAKHQNIYIKKGVYTDGEPKVRWRGIFINDEHPSFYQWSKGMFGGQNSKWINISPIPRIWKQMNLAYRYGIDKIWIVNVGDLKPMEYPIQFFLDMAWDPEAYNPQNLTQHTVDFCRTVFGEEYADEGARLLRTYAKYNRRRTPESLDDETYSLANYHEWEQVTAAYNQLALDAHALENKLPSGARDAWYQLLGYPIKASANLYDMYYALAMNKQLAKNSDPMANLWADRVEECFNKTAEFTRKYHEINGGKWNHMMEERYIGYKSWNGPKKNVMPEVVRVEGTPTGSVILPVPAAEVYADPGKSPTFIEKDGYVSIEAEHFTRKTDGRMAKWTVIPDMGRTLSAITTLPITEPVDGMVLEYDFELSTDGDAKVMLRFNPTLNFNTTGLRYAVSVDGGDEKVVNINGSYAGELGQWQREHVIDSENTIPLKAGRHTLRYRPLDNALVLQKIVINMGGHGKCYLWAPETGSAGSPTSR